MNITVALDGSKRRDLTLRGGDEVTLAVTVYAVDGDAVPIDPSLVTNPRIVTCPQARVTFPVASFFTVPADTWPRTRYRLVAEVDGLTTTLAEGHVTTRGSSWCCWSGGSDYGGPWGWGYP